MRTLLHLTCLTILVTSGMAGAAIETGHFATDDEMLAVLSDTLFVAEGRVGDLGGAATFELDLGYSTAAPDAWAQYAWINSQDEPFTLAFDPGTSTVTFSLGGETLTYTTEFEEFGVMFLRTRAVNAATEVSLTDLLLDGLPLNDQSVASGDGGGLDILWVTGADLRLGFTLAGTANLAWTGAAPTQSRLAFQIKVARYSVVGTQGSTWGRIRDLYR